MRFVFMFWLLFVLKNADLNASRFVLKPVIPVTMDEYANNSRELVIQIEDDLV